MLNSMLPAKLRGYAAAQLAIYAEGARRRLSQRGERAQAWADLLVPLAVQGEGAKAVAEIEARYRLVPLPASTETRAGMATLRRAWTALLSAPPGCACPEDAAIIAATAVIEELYTILAAALD